MAIKSSNMDTRCAKQAWVLEALSSEEAMADSTSSLELEQHLSVCPSCHKLAGRVGSVTAGLASLTLLGPGADLLGKATAQVSRALQTGGQFTGRVDIPFGPDGALRHVWPWTKIGVFAVATIVIIAFSAVWLNGYRRVHKPIDHMGHRSPTTNTIQNPWSAYGSRSPKTIDRAADIGPSTNQQTNPTTAPATKTGQSIPASAEPLKSDFANPPPEQD